MKANIHEYTSRFWRCNKEHPLRPTDSFVYFYLLDCAIKEGIDQPFSIKTIEVLRCLEISSRTFNDVRKRLIKRGLIMVKNGKDRSAKPMYFYPSKEQFESVIRGEEQKSQKIAKESGIVSSVHDKSGIVSSVHDKKATTESVWQFGDGIVSSVHDKSGIVSSVHDKTGFSFPQETINDEAHLDINIYTSSYNTNTTNIKSLSKDNSLSESAVSSEVSSSPDCRGSRPDPVPYQKIKEFWNKSMQGKSVKQIKVLTPTTATGKNVAARFRQYSIEGIYEVITNCANSDFLNGYNDKGWMATFDWVFKPCNFDKIINGNYANKEERHETNQTDRLCQRRGFTPATTDRKSFKGTL